MFNFFKLVVTGFVTLLTIFSVILLSVVLGLFIVTFYQILLVVGFFSYIVGKTIEVYYKDES